LMRCATRNVFVKSPNEQTNPEWGTSPEKRSTETYIRYGFVILDKPRGPTSHEAVAWLKRILGVERAGHAGTLDPKVSGVLPVAIAESTKMLMALSKSDKAYVAVAKFHGDVDEESLRRVLEMFRGDIWQRPPLRSSVKRSLRVRKVYDLQLLEMDGRYAVLYMYVEAGTYARKLIHDIGEVLGVSANMRELRRVSVGCFTEDEAVTLQDIADAVALWRRYGDDTMIRRVIRPVEEMVRHLPKVWVKDGAVDALCHGASLAAPGVVKFEEPFTRGQLLAIMTLKNELIGLAKALVDSEEVKRMERGLVAKMDRVLMRKGTYPPLWREKKQAEAKSKEG